MRWTAMLDLAAIAGVCVTTWGFCDLGARLGLGPALGLLWAGGTLIAAAIWIARGVSRHRK